MHLDLLVIGSGPGGYRAAVLGALRGLKVGIVEKAEWGGCCLNRGCVPKKTWYHSARLIAGSRAFAKRGIQGSLQGDLQAAWEHQKKVVRSVRDSYLDYMKRLGVSGFAATASFVDAHTVALDGRDQIQAGHIIIATGGYPYVPKPFHLTDGKILTSDDLFSQPPPPGTRVAVIGSGIIGAEFAFILAMLGKQVSWVAQQQPLSKLGFSTPTLKLLMERFKALGIEPRLGHRPEAVEMLPEGVKLILQGGADEVVADWVLLGTGRRPHTNSLNLDAAGVSTDSRGFVKVNEHLQTTQPHIYAIGDVANQVMTANQALADAAIAVANILEPGSRRQNRRAVPALVYSALEMGRIGMNEEEAEEAGKEPAVGFAAFESNPWALGQDDTEGFVRLVADMDSGELLGAEVVGADAGELIHLVAQQYGQPAVLRRLAQSFYNHPARAEEFLNATETLAAKWGLTHRVFGAD